LHLIEAWLGIQRCIADQALMNGEFTLMHVSKPKESILKTCCDVLFHNYQKFVMKLTFSYFLFHNF